MPYKKKVAVVGYGSIGRRHVEILQSLDEVAEIIVFTKQKIQTSIKKVNHFEELNNVNPDYFVLASNTALHFEQLSYLEHIFSGKTILVEKPLFDKYYGLKITKNSVYVGYNLRFHPVIKLIKEKINNRKLWNINIFCGSFLPDWRSNIDYRESSSASKFSAGGVLLDLSHELDYVQWLCGTIKLEFVRNGKISNLDIETDDILLLFGKSEKCSHISITLSYFTRKPVRKILIDGDGICIQADLVNNSAIISEDGNASNNYSWPELNKNSTYRSEHKAILSKETSDICSYMQGLETMVLIDAIRQWQE